MDDPRESLHGRPAAEDVAAEALEPMGDWVHVQPSADDERAGRIILPATVGQGRLQRSMVLAVGDEVTDLAPGDIVMVLPVGGAGTGTGSALDLRDGSQLVRRSAVVARIR